MKIVISLLIFLFTWVASSTAQQKYPIPIFLPDYGVYLKITNDIDLNDTAKIPYSEKIYFRFVFFDSRGKSYCEVYRNGKLHEKGYYENSLDTLKKYSTAVTINKRDKGKVRVIQYFQPLKNGEWFETKQGKLIRRRYNMGVEEMNADGE